MNDTDQITIYRPNMRHDLGWFECWGVMARNVWGSRELIWQLFKRDFFAQYKKSFIGYAWAFIGPILGVVSWIFMQMTGLLKPGDVGIPYPAYVLIGSSMWGLYAGFLGSAQDTLSSGGALVMQVKYPHEAMLFKQVANQLAGFCITFVVNIAVLIAFKVVPSWATVFLPFVALPMFFLGSAIGLIMSMIGIVAVDISRVIGIPLGLLYYVTPVIYSDAPANPVLAEIIKWNPLTYLVCSCRDLVIYGRLYNPTGYFITSAACFVLFMLSWRLFFVSEDKLVERMI